MARDTSGNVVAIIPWGSAWNRPDQLRTAAHLTPFENQLLLVRVEEAGVQCVLVRLGAREDTAHIVVMPGGPAAELAGDAGSGICADSASGAARRP